MAILIAGGLAVPGCVLAVAFPPICPHVNLWDSQVTPWAQGAPWVKVIHSDDIPLAQACGAKVFYRPWDADATYHDDGCLPESLTGSQFADLVWAKIYWLTKKPDAVGYRNEFNWGGPCNRRTAAQFRPFRDRLRALGYNGKVVFGSFGVGWISSATWDEPEILDACAAADAIETHEYFDLTVDCQSPQLAFRHRDLAINAHPDHLGGKEWFIGEFGADGVCDQAYPCSDYPTCRNGWRDNGKLTEQEYINELAAYRIGCHPNVTAIFLFKQGGGGFPDFEILGTSVAEYVRTTWSGQTGVLTGTVKTVSGQVIAGAVVTTRPGGQSATTDGSGVYRFSAIPTGTYTATASKPGYYPQIYTTVVISGGRTETRNFSLTPAPTALRVAEVSTDPTVVVQGQNAIPVSMTLQNPGLEDVRITGSGLAFKQGPADVGAGYAVAPLAGNGDLIARGSSLVLSYLVEAGAETALGPTTIDGFAEGWPNLCPNGSFEEGTTRWYKTNATGGTADWSVDSNQKTHGTRSLRLYTINTSSGYVQADTGYGPSDLLPVRQNCQYTLSCYSRSVMYGSASLLLGYQQYASNYQPVSSLVTVSVPVKSSFARTYTSFVPSVGAAYVQVVLRVTVSGPGTIAYAWFDDVQLREGRIAADDSADAPDSWTVIADPPPMSISAAKDLPDGSSAALSGVVTAKFSSSGAQERLYIQDADRSSGIAVISSAGASLGDYVQAKGILATAAGERTLNAATVQVMQAQQAAEAPSSAAKEEPGARNSKHRGTKLKL